MSKPQFESEVPIAPAPAAAPAMPAPAMRTLNFCAHEHWGSFQAIGPSEDGFRADVEPGAKPSRRVTIWDLMLDPYLGWFLAAAGVEMDAQAKEAGAADFQAWWESSPQAAFDAVLPHLERQRMTGTFQCIVRGIQLCHYIDLQTITLERWHAASKQIGAAYDRIFGWYREVMQRAGFSQVIRPVHPEFYFRDQTDAAAQEELSFTKTVLRIDPLLKLWPAECPRRTALAGIIGVEPRDASSWRAFLDRLFDAIAARGALGIKQLQAYSRTLEFRPRDDAEVTWSGDLTPEQVTVFQDWVVHECCKRANDLAWPHQVHVGTHNLPRSSPLPLDALARRYPNMSLVMIHCWPYIEEAGFLAKHIPNVYIDTCWMPVLNPAFFQRALNEWLGYVPSHKIMCSHDATSIEMAVGSSLFSRELLTTALHGHALRCGVDPFAFQYAADDILHNNAVRVYRAGSEADARAASS